VVALSATTLVLAACGGGSTPATPGVAAGPVAPAGAGPSAAGTPATAGTGTLSFAITVPSAQASTASRSVKYVSPATQSVAVTLQGQTTPLATANLSTTAPGCSAGTGGTVCTVSVSAPAGSDTFVIAAYSGANGTGQQLSVASVPATITTSSTTRVPLTLNGTVATVSLTLGSTNVPVGTPATVAVNVVALDASGNQIVGPGNFSTPVTLADSDTSGTTSLSSTTVAAPGTSVTLSYTGNSLFGATITPSINGTPGTAATFAPSGYAHVDFTTPSSLGSLDAIAAGPLVNGKGNVWFSTSVSDCECTPITLISQITPLGAVTTYATGLPSDPIYALVTGPDGNLWFGDDGDGNIGYVNPSTGAVTPATSYTTPCSNVLCGGLNGMATGPDGNIWFVDANGYVGRISLPSGAVREWSITALSGWNSESYAYSNPDQMTFASDGKIYIADYAGTVDQITLAGDVPASVVQVPDTACPYVYAIATGTDGNVWFGDGCANLGRIPTGANFSPSNLLLWGVGGSIGGSSFESFASSASGIWATNGSSTSNTIFQILTSPAVTASQGPPIVPVQATGSNSQSEFYPIALGPDGNVWTGSYSNSASPVIAKVFFGVSSVNALSAKRATGAVSRAVTPVSGSFAHRLASFKRRHV
jgi:streptogramin lyase